MCSSLTLYDRVRCVVCREENEGIYRDVLSQLSTMLAASPFIHPAPNLVVREVYVIKHDNLPNSTSIAGQDDDRQELVMNTTLLHKDSTFCFVPRGDTPTSRRLFDSLGLGCVPIIMETYENIAPNLPFTSIIDWPSIAIFAGGLKCTTDSVNSTAKWLTDAVRFSRSECGAASLDWMRARGQATFVRSLSYAAGSGIVGALLEQAAVQLALV